MTDVIDILLPLIFIAGGIGLCGVALWAFVRTAQARNWPATSARIISSEARRKPGRHTRYEPVIAYEYSVEGKAYSGNTVAFVQPIYSREEQVRRVLERYTPGTTAPVYYHPRKPGVSALERGNPLHALFGVVVGAVFAGAGWWFLTHR